MIRLRFSSLIALLFIALPAFLCGTATAQSLKELVGYTKLQTEFGGSLATGAGITVGLIEADTDVSNTTVAAYMPNTGIADFTGKTFLNNPPAGQTVALSGHATSVGQNFFGNSTSLSPGVVNVQVYEANDFVDFRQKFGTASDPDIITASVINHSYVGFGLTVPQATEINARLDYTVNRDNLTSVVALNNGVGAVPQLYGQSYNSIVVGRSDGQHSFGTTTVGGAGRTKPDIVTPQGSTSMATPVVSSAAALLHSAAVANSMTDARNSETMKAIIMAGATKTEFPGWSNTTTRPLDTVFGAGELNIYNSYKILLGGEQAGSSTEPVMTSSLRGWDYADSIDPLGSLFWNFEVTAGQEISEASILLTWNAQYGTSNFNNTLSLANMDMRFYNSTGGFLGTLLSSSLSTVDNVEHIYLKNLSAGTYTLAINSNISTAFGLAWNLVAVPEPTSLMLVGLVATISISFRRRDRK